MKTRSTFLIAFIVVQLVLLVVLRGTYLVGAGVSVEEMKQHLYPASYLPQVQFPRKTALVITPLYDRPEMVSDEDLAMVLTKLQPNFGKTNISPNHVEHALRIWTIHSKFRNPEVMSGEFMKEFLLNSSLYADIWGRNTEKLLVEEPAGFSVRYGRSTGPGGSVHHDHTLACLTEGGIALDEPVFLASGRTSDIQYMVEQSLRDFQLDERETEWSTMAYALWISPTKSWQLPDGRTISFDMLADRLIRGQLETGVCSGTHRIYTLMVLWRINQEMQILSPEHAQKIHDHLSMVRDMISQSQFEDGHWPSNWWAGKAALEHPKEDDLPAKVIATGHHLEWLAIAPEELHPSKEIMEKAARWCINTTRELDQKSIYARYTFFTHVGNALALWRNYRPHVFYHKWEEAHPDLNLKIEAPAMEEGNKDSKH